MNGKEKTNKAATTAIIEKDGIYYETDFETFKEYYNIKED
jgi:hypothetical protein